MIVAEIKIGAICLAAGLLVGAWGAWMVTSGYKDNKHQAAISSIYTQANADINAANALAEKATTENAAITRKLEIQDHAAKSQLDKIAADNRRLARELGGLRDPYAVASGCKVPTADTTSIGATDSTTAGRLSTEASQFLLDSFADADEVASYAATCHAYAKQVEAQVVALSQSEPTR